VPRKYTPEEREARARPDYHDPFTGGGLPPARSALTLRLVLASFGVVVCGLATAGWVIVAHQDVLAGIFAFFGAVALVDIIVVARRKLRGEPG
jgi:Family of unknown function (DUF6343)